MELPQLKPIGPNSGVKKKKILLLSDDLRVHSGIGTMSRAFVSGTINKYDWAQIGGAINHPEHGKVIDMSEYLKNELRIKNGYLKIYPVAGYERSTKH